MAFSNTLVSRSLSSLVMLGALGAWGPLAHAQGHVATGSFQIGQKLGRCPAPSKEEPTTSKDGMVKCGFAAGVQQVFGQPTEQLFLLLNREKEVEGIFAITAADEGKKAMEAARAQLGQPNWDSKNAREPGAQWIRDDDLLIIGVTAVGEGKRPAGAIVLSSLNGLAVRQAADKFSNAADECLLDARDRGISYERSQWCASAKDLHLAYLNTDDNYSTWKDTTKVPQHAYVVAQARGVLYNALAISNARHGTKRLSLW